MSLRLPRIYLLPTNLGPDELQSLENRIPSLTRDVREAEVIVGRITRRERALFELRRLKLPLSLSPSDPAHPEQQQQDHEDHPTKRRRVSPTGGTTSDDAAPSVKVVKLQWLNDCLEQDTVLPMGNSLLFAGRKLETPEVQVLSATPSPRHSQVSSVTEPSVRSGSVIASAHRQEQTSCSPRARRPPALIRETTSEHGAPLPPVPDYLHTVYSCQRPTPVDTPNASFIEQMKKLRTLRRLEHDEVGVRAYSTSIATIAAYPYALGSPLEISRLPGCGPKIVELFKQWKNTGTLEEVEKGDADAMVSVLKLFYGIWGVGEATAREFYNKGWRDLDDIVLNGWSTLSRVQQIGVKYYDELELKIPRDEVKDIGRIILSELRMLDDGYELTIAGGYRRGKARSGDADIVVSHPDERRTFRLVEKLVVLLEVASYITHTLSLGTHNSERGQMPLPWKGTAADGSLAGPGGFDTLDKALVIWQDPGRHNAPHRRVDIIVSPWKTVGCALLGWTGATTFQRDLRRYCKERGLKFDSSGVRRRADGAWVDLERASTDDPAPDMETAEKRVFQRLGLAWREPSERCTG